MAMTFESWWDENVALFVKTMPDGSPLIPLRSVAHEAWLRGAMEEICDRHAIGTDAEAKTEAA